MIIGCRHLCLVIHNTHTHIYNESRITKLLRQRNRGEKRKRKKWKGKWEERRERREGWKWRKGDPTQEIKIYYISTVIKTVKYITHVLKT